MERRLESPGPRMPKATWSFRASSLSREQMYLGLISQEANTEVFKWFASEWSQESPSGRSPASDPAGQLCHSWTTHIL